MVENSTARAETAISGLVSREVVAGTALDRARQMVVSEGRRWLGTPFMHAQRMHGVGVDCAQLLIACYCETGVVEPVAPARYMPQWYRHDGSSLLTDWLAERCVVIPSESREMRGGEIVVFRFGQHDAHAAISIGGDAVIHAVARRGVVIDSIGAHTPLRARLSSVWMPKGWS